MRLFFANLFAAVFGRSVDSITAKLGSLIDELEAHATDKAVEAKGHRDVADEAVLNANIAASEASRAQRVATNLKTLVA